MFGIIWLCFWQALGILISDKLFRERRRVIIVWLGSVIGLLLAMWTPVVPALFLGFTVKAHILALAAGLGAASGLFLARGKGESPLGALRKKQKTNLRPVFLTGLFFAFTAFILYTHTLRPINGAYYTGQSTYGDMPMHLSFITSMAEQGRFPFEYSLLPGTALNYPFLCDSVSASLYLLGTGLRWAYMLPMLIALADVFCGVWHLAALVTRSSRAALFAFLFFFLNGGFGVIYFLNGDYSFSQLMNGFYFTPTNLTDEGMRWVNVICDMLIPQRATLFGWCALFAVMYLLYIAVFGERERKYAICAGILGGAVPMVHTHSFFALGLVSICWMIYTLSEEKQKRSSLFINWLVYGFLAVGLAAPQLFAWTFRSVGGSDHFLRLHLDWVNNGNENFFVFWLKNIGILIPLSVIAFFTADRDTRGFASGAILIFVIGELFVFQPNVYDNNKIFYVGYRLACILSASELVTRLSALKSGKLRVLLAAVLLIISSNAAALSIAREINSGLKGNAYCQFDESAVMAAEYIKSNTEPSDVFLTADNHNNAVASLTGRNIVCGSPSYLFYHGLDYSTANTDAKRMLSSPGSSRGLFDKYNVDYVFIGPSEIYAGADKFWFDEYFDTVYSYGNAAIYKVRQEKE